MQPLHPSLIHPLVQPVTNWRYGIDSAPIQAAPIPRHLPRARATNWRYGALANRSDQPIAPAISTKSFAVNWRYQISIV